MMSLEVVVPDDWTPGQTFAVQQLLQHAIRTAFPVIAFVRKDATAEQVKDIYDRVQALIREAGLQVDDEPEAASGATESTVP